MNFFNEKSEEVALPHFEGSGICSEKQTNSLPTLESASKALKPQTNRFSGKRTSTRGAVEVQQRSTPVGLAAKIALKDSKTMSTDTLPPPGSSSADAPPLRKRSTRSSTAAAAPHTEEAQGTEGEPPFRGPPAFSGEEEQGVNERGAHAELSDEALLLQRPPHAAKQTLGVREYLETEIIPALLPALTAVCEERPPTPIEFLAHYLLEKSYRKGI
ncbi:hypothetical protein Esti_000866 [Eimeria stiedai]